MLKQVYSALQAKAILQSNFISNNTDKTENKMKQKKVKKRENNKNHILPFMQKKPGETASA